ncbi:MAG TPA: toll/interleukin-1 receptor domain-containing protein [Ktedonobacterales bacterium]
MVTARTKAALATGRADSVIICASDAPCDRAFARRLAGDIQRMGYTPRYHRKSNETPWTEDEVGRARAALVVLSPFLESAAVARMEYQSAAQRRTPIVPLQTAVEMPPIPPEIQQFQWVDFYELYERGLANLTRTLGRPQETALRRLRRAALLGKVVPFARTALAAFLLAMWLLLLNDIFGNGVWVLALLPALFVAVGVEQYRRGEPPGWRITLTKILAGAALTALPVLALAAHYPTTPVYWFTGILALIGGLMAWLLMWIELRSLKRGRLGARRTLGIFRFLLNAFIIGGALIGAAATASSLPYLPNANLRDPLTETLIGVAAVAVSVVVAAEVEWLRSPLRRVTSARRQLVETGESSGRIAKPERSSTVTRAAPVVFISHSSADNDFAIRLSHDLQARGIASWVDRRQLRAGMSWSDEIQQALDRSQVILMALSTLSAASEWVRREYQTALAQAKRVIVLRLDTETGIPADLSHTGTADFSTLYENGLADALALLGASQQALDGARQALLRRLRYAWLISLVRLVAAGYLLLARSLVFGVASFTLLGGFEHVAGVRDLAVYPFIWLARAAPGATLGVFVSLGERARIEGAKPRRWISLARVVNAALTGEGWIGVWTFGVLGLIFSPATWLAVLFLSAQTPGGNIANELARNAASHNSSPSVYLIFAASIAGIGLVNAALAVPLARAERRSREQGKRMLLILSAIAGYASRAGIGMLGVVIPVYLAYLSPVNPFGPPPPDSATILGYTALVGLVVGALVAAIDLFFFPAGPPHQALKKLRMILLGSRRQANGPLPASA